MNRTIVETTPEARHRLRRVAVERNVTMKQLMEELAKHAERETFGSVREYAPATEREAHCTTS